MKDFFKTLFAVILGMILSFIFLFFLLVGIGASSGSKTVLPREGVLTMDMSKIMLADKAKDDNIPALLAGRPKTKTIGILDAVNAIDIASEDPGVEYIYIKPDGLNSSISNLYELRKALSEFRKKGKSVVSFVENPGLASYYLASVSDKVYMTSAEGSGAMLVGLSGRLMFLKDLLDKFGVNVQLIRHGKYKSAGEMFVKSTASKENIEQNEAMIKSLWKTIGSQIADSRHISLKQLDLIINNLSLNTGKDMLKYGLVDTLMSKEELKSQLAILAKKENFNDVKAINFADYVKLKVLPNLKAENKIAVLYAEGDIVEGNDNNKISGDRFASLISEIRADSTVKAVVFRVNSPGGSVLASDKIKQEIDLLKEVKPVIASYGSYAASGGYWISNSCEKVYSTPLTLTGSIGVFSMVPDLSKTSKQVLHINMVPVNSHNHSDMFTMMRPFDKEELIFMQSSVEQIYDAFLDNVSKGRDLRKSFVDSVAQGRVWTGADALRLGLVDELGTLEDAVKYANSLVNIMFPGEGVQVEAYPKQKTTFEEIMSMVSENSVKANNILLGTPFEQMGNAIMDWKKTWNDSKQGKVYARMPYDIVFE